MNEHEINALIAQGDEKAEGQQYDEALALYRHAVTLVTEPLGEQEIATALLTAIGDAYYMKGEYSRAEQAFRDVMLCPGGPQSDYVRLRRGQIAYELGDLKRAATELACAYMNGGGAVFADEDPKYFQLVQETLKRVNR